MKINKKRKCSSTKPNYKIDSDIKKNYDNIAKRELMKKKKNQMKVKIEIKTENKKFKLCNKDKIYISNDIDDEDEEESDLKKLNYSNIKNDESSIIDISNLDVSDNKAPKKFNNSLNLSLRLLSTQFLEGVDLDQIRQSLLNTYTNLSRI